MRLWLSLIFTLWASGLWLVAIIPSAADPTHLRPDGFWKEQVGGRVKGEFGGEDPVGLASGKHIPTNCAIHRTLDGGKIYCFSTVPSLELLDSNRDLLDKARTFWVKEHAASSGR